MGFRLRPTHDVGKADNLARLDAFDDLFNLFKGFFKRGGLVLDFRHFRVLLSTS
jgi:hypothetical protein